MKPSNPFAESDALVKYTRLSARRPAVRQLDHQLSAAQVWPQRLVVHGPRLRCWRFASLPDPRKDPRHARFVPVSPVSDVLSTSSAAMAWLDVVQPIAERYVAVADANPASPVWQSEVGAWKKVTIQAGHPIFSHVPASNSEPRFLRIPQGFRECLAHVVRQYRLGYAKYVAQHGVPVDKPDPSDTSGGFPLFVTHPAAKVAGAALGYHHGSYDSLLTAAVDWCRAVGVPDDFALANGMGFRSGPMYKWAPIWEPDGSGSWTAKAEWQGHSQRRRIVQMSPYPVNRLLRPFFSALHAARTMIPGLWRVGDSDQRMMLDFVLHYEADISGYDLSVQVQLQALVCDVIRSEWPELAAAALTWLHAEQRGLIGPSWRLREGECSFVSSIGATSSGLKPTAEIGTLIATACTRWALHQQGDSYTNWPDNPTYPSLHQGDDARVAGNIPLDADKWRDAFADIGLDCDLIAGYTFLARLHLPNGRLAPLSGRLVQQTMSNEHEPRGPHTLGLHYLGFGARAAQALNCDADRLADVWSCIKDANWIRDVRRWYGVHDVASLLDFTNSHPAAKAEIEVAVRAAASDTWLMRHARDAEHSSASAAIVALAASRGWSTDQHASADYTCERVCNNVSSLDPTRRRALLMALTEAALSGRAALDAKWVELLTTYA